jgi:hypothetical protein
MRLLATVMTSITLVPTALFLHALVTADEPSAPAVARVASR